MKKITKKELNPILEQHKLLLDSNEEDGKYVYFTGANLRHATLSDANLRRADLSGANLTGAYLTNTILDKKEAE